MGMGTPRIGMGRDNVNNPNRGVPIAVWGSFQFGDQHIYQGLITTSCQISFEFLFIKTCPPHISDIVF